MAVWFYCCRRGRIVDVPYAFPPMSSVFARRGRRGRRRAATYANIGKKAPSTSSSGKICTFLPRRKIFPVVVFSRGLYIFPRPNAAVRRQLRSDGGAARTPVDAHFYGVSLGQGSPRSGTLGEVLPTLLTRCFAHNINASRPGLFTGIFLLRPPTFCLLLIRKMLG